MNLPITLKLCGFKKNKFWREGVQDLGLGCPSSGSLTYLLSGCGWGLQAPEVQFSRSVVSDSLQPHDTACQASLSITNSRSLLKLMSIESVMPSSHLILCHPLLLLPSIFPSIRVFSNESALCIMWPKDWSFNFNISPSDEHPGLISFRLDWLDLLAVQRTLKSLLQHHSSKAFKIFSLKIKAV